MLLVALLPIRSWASESMGLKIVYPAHSMQMMADGDASHCEMMQSSPTNSNSQSAHHGKPVCQACSLCMAFAFTAAAIPMNMNFCSHHLVVREVLLIDSASLALPLKPPIF